ncbi:MAG: basic amino acid ABC transporter substrate-binding protein [Lachnospiraceae bacterium]|nr:basic amino acid ABC transporter substrate-binding protein [Lachnospiraceae bacterium]MEE3356816.1 basic amino acid ABC transporter substrate-binding protein [Lachnospiraceae bacterium]
MGKKNLKKIMGLVLLGAMVMGMMTACGSSSSKKNSDTLVMATNATFPPYESVSGDDIVGIDVDIANAIAKKLGKKLKIEDVSFDSIIAGVQNDKYDFGMAGMTVTDERKKNVDFTESYAKAVQVVIVKEDSDIKSIDDISSKNKIGVQQGTTGDIYASDTVENGGYGEDAVTKYNSGPDAVQALLSDKVDCVIIDNEPAKAYVAANQGLKILDSSFADEEYAICVKKGNSQLKNDINKALKELKDDGTIDKIVSKYIK